MHYDSFADGKEQAFLWDNWDADTVTTMEVACIVA